LSDPAQGHHAVNIALQTVVNALEAFSGLTAETVRTSPVVPIADNYDRLFYEPDAVARSTRYSHYVDDNRILRTHTTAAIPDELCRTKSDRFIVCPGLVYRRDVVDRTHVGEPHQADFWIIKSDRLRRSDLQAMIAAVIDSLLPGSQYRCNETFHPYTVNGLEVEVLVGDRWIELLECGEAHPWLLNDSGLPSQKWSGLAMGIGLDRLVMLLKGVDDIRLLRATDPRITGQMPDLSAYRPVSNQPATHRDMSLCVADPDPELLGDQIRDCLGTRADWVEDITIRQQSDYETTPVVARARLGMLQGQVNLLVRITLRSVDGPIPREEGNKIYDLLYAHLHEGSAGYIRNG
jgi:phenylalanyl-tRNA synthetase alpha chain